MGPFRDQDALLGRDWMVCVSYCSEGKTPRNRNLNQTNFGKGENEGGIMFLLKTR